MLKDYAALIFYGTIVLFAAVMYLAPGKTTRIKAFPGLARRQKERREKQEALFKATFPELQPHLHPEEVLQFVSAWRKRPASPEPFEWRHPRGFASATARFARAGDKGQPAEIVDEGGEVLARFVVQDHPEGGALRIGPGKLTVNVQNESVRYWHPEREFKWSRVKGFRMITSLSNRGIVSTDQGTFYSSSDRSYSASTAATAAAAGAAAVTGAGGAFDGGGSSQSWDESADSRTSY